MDAIRDADAVAVETRANQLYPPDPACRSAIRTLGVGCPACWREAVEQACLELGLDADEFISVAGD